MRGEEAVGECEREDGRERRVPCTARTEAGSLCPMAPLMLCSGSGERPAAGRRNVSATDLASIVSPSAVPVAAASRELSAVVSTPAVPNAARYKAPCTVPLGAVRLALLPSERTALPSRAGDPLPSNSQVPSATAEHASLRAWPSARASKA